MTWQAEDPQNYLAMDKIIDGDRPSVDRLAIELRAGHPDKSDFAAAAFAYVRDQVRHSFDSEDSRVSITASETLAHGVGLCYAKAHLLTALLRHQGIPTGLCYQLLTDDGRSFVVHGLVAVHLDGSWHRQDPRGNRDGVDAQFSLGAERLAWPVRPEAGERDDPPRIRVAPLDSVIATLRSTDDVLSLRHGGLPDQI